MANVVKCPVCNSFYNGAIYEKCPYCSKDKIKPVTGVQPSEEPKKAVGLKIPFPSIHRSSGKKGSISTDQPTVIPTTGGGFKPTEILSPENTASMDATVSLWDQQQSEKELSADKDIAKPENVGYSNSNALENSMEAANSLSTAISRTGRTVGKYISSSTGESISPVVGWIIGVKGGDYGRSFNLKAGKNKIGRSTGMDVELSEESVSRSSVAVIAYDSKQKEFSLLLGESDSLCYLNGSAVYERCVLRSGDELEFGDSELNKYIFIPLCGEAFDWEKYPTTKKND